ncbi:MAG: WS/DGAT domain-containing protein [Acidimicrobiia bacterium]|nr:WS/DGAT domain-containing protein [Acidimicrobiia bacterium]
MERLTVEDAAFLDLEDEVIAMHNVTIAVFEGTEPALADLHDRVHQRIRYVPRLRQRVVSVPLDLGRPVWVDDVNFALDYHLRRTGLPRRATMADLRNLVGRLLSQRLDRGKPLWELWLVSGLPGRRWALISKTHYAVIDGVSGADPLSIITDQTKESAAATSSDDGWSPPPAPSGRRILTETAAELAINPIEQYRLVRRKLVEPAIRVAGSATGGSTQAARAGLTGAVGPHRRWHPAAVDGSTIRALRDRHEVTTNDVVLALITRGYRSMLEAGGRPLPHTLRTLAPLAVATGDHFTNEVTALEADLPVRCETFAETVQLIHDQTRYAIGGLKPVAGATLSELPGLVAPNLCGLGLRSATQAGTSLSGVQTVTVNAPGPYHEVTVLDRRMVELYPAIPLVARVRIAVGVMSFRGSFGFGVTGDRDAGLEIEALATGIERAAASASGGATT